MPEQFPLMVPGATPDGDLMEVHAPYDRSLIATVERGGPQVVEKALDTAYRLFRDRDAWLSAARRIEILRGAAAIMQERREELAVEAAREGGKPLMDSLVEVDRAVDGVHECVEFLRAQHGDEIPMGLNAASANRLAFTRHEPIGVVVPAEATPLSAMRFVGILREAGLPEEWCQGLVTTDLDVAGSLATDGRVGFFSFIGSARVGWMLRSKLARGTRSALEHGGVAPVLVAEDADLDHALPLITKGGFYHAGQVCVSVQRVFAHRSVARELAERLAQAATALNVGDPTSPETEVGPLIRPTEVERVGEWVKEAVDQGGELLTGGEALSETCYAPTVLYDPPGDAQVSVLEIFGPVVCVYPYDEVDEAIARSNSLPYAFQASVFTRDLDTALRASRRLDASAVMVNDHPAFRVDWMPFAGLRESGIGVGGIPYTMQDMQIKKLVVIRSKEL